MTPGEYTHAKLLHMLTMLEQHYTAQAKFMAQLRNDLQQPEPEPVQASAPTALNIKANRNDLIAVALRNNKGNRKLASRELGISERSLYRYLKRYEMP